jgi:hypothetical protein
MILGDIKEAGADLVYGRINWVGSVWGRISRPQVRLVVHLPAGLNLIVVGTQGRFSDGDHVNVPASHPDRSWGIGEQERTNIQ